MAHGLKYVDEARDYFGVSPEGFFIKPTPIVDTIYGL